MNRIYYYICLIALLAAACAKEEALKPSGIEENYLTIPEDATDEVSVLRREFEQRTGVHLLFNDTIRVEQQGAYDDGTPVWYVETIDFNYYMVSSNDYSYMFGYITDYDDMVAASEAVEEYVLPYLGEHGFYNIVVAGYTDNTGSPIYCLRRSDEQAVAVADRLRQLTGSQSIMEFGMGNESPLLPNNTVDNRAVNRRIEILLVPGDGMLEQAAQE